MTRSGASAIFKDVVTTRTSFELQHEYDFVCVSMWNFQTNVVLEESLPAAAPVTDGDDVIHEFTFPFHSSAPSPYSCAGRRTDKGW